MSLKAQDDALSKKIQEIDTVEKIEVKKDGRVSESLSPNVFYDFTGRFMGTVTEKVLT